jgi:RNA polymerase sigma-70 factor, ECF subfamily
MDEAKTLSAQFLAHIPEAVSVDGGDGGEVDLATIDGRLADILEELELAWPRLCPIDATGFIPFVAAKLSPEHAWEDGLNQLKMADLYLVHACLKGQGAALAIFSTGYLPEVELTVKRMASAAHLADEVKQKMQNTLLIAEDDRPAKLSRFGGRGDLRSWLRVSATRTALDFLRRDKRKADVEDDRLVEHLAAVEGDQELQYLKRLYRAEFKAAFQIALSELEIRERNVLRQQLLDGVTIEQAAKMQQVNRSTVVRWNSKIREKLLSSTRRVLLGRLKIDHHEFESIMRLIRSQFDVSICRHLDE